MQMQHCLPPPTKLPDSNLIANLQMAPTPAPLISILLSTVAEVGMIVFTILNSINLPRKILCKTEMIQVQVQLKPLIINQGQYRSFS